MRVTFKYPVPISALDSLNSVAIDMPAGAEILSVAEQHSRLTLWAKVDPEAANIKRRLVVLGTGNAFDEDELRDAFSCEEPFFVGTALLHDGALVLHVYDYGVC